MNIALCIMVKNEIATLPRLLESVSGIVDKIIALDTGSTDGTVEWLKARGADVKCSEFVDFGASRTELMKFARDKADWLLLLDADMTLDVGDPLAFEALDPRVPVFSLKHAGSNQYWTPRIVRSDRAWRFIGPVHEYLEGGETAVKLEGASIVHHADGGSRANKFERDLRLLSAANEADPTNARTMFYLANTLRDLGRLEQARLAYLRRVALGGWPEEIFVAALESAKISRSEQELLDVWKLRPSRAEPLFELVKILREQGRVVEADAFDRARGGIPVPSDILFVLLSAYG